MRQRAKRNASSWTVFWLCLAAAIQGVQALLYGLPSVGGPHYRYIYDTSTDFCLIALSIAAFCSMSYYEIGKKAFAFGLSACFAYSAASNIITDYFIDTESNILGLTLFTIAIYTLIFAFRFVFTFKPSNTPIERGKIYLLIGRPTSLVQILAAFRTGRGGSFSVTDGVHTWKFMEDVSLLCKLPFKQEHINKKMIGQ